jgi:hypothetical protein
MGGNANNRSPLTGAFHVRDCALVAMATGYASQNLREFKEAVLRVHEGSIYHHFWGRFLEPQFDEPEYNNDFAAWVFHGLNEKDLAEKLGVIDPTNYPDINALRQVIVERVEDKLDENEFIAWARADQQFHFIRSQIVVLDTGQYVDAPSELPKTVAQMALGSIFYHFIDARRRTEARTDDFSAWLIGWGDRYLDLRTRLMSVDPYFSSLKELRKIVSEIFEEYFQGVNP